GLALSKVSQAADELGDVRRELVAPRDMVGGELLEVSLGVGERGRDHRRLVGWLEICYRGHVIDFPLVGGKIIGPGRLAAARAFFFSKGWKRPPRSAAVRAPSAEQSGGSPT